MSNVITSTIGQKSSENFPDFILQPLGKFFPDPKHRLVRIDAGVTNPILFSNKGLKVKKCFFL